MRVIGTDDLQVGEKNPNVRRAMHNAKRGCLLFSKRKRKVDERR